MTTRSEQKAAIESGLAMCEDNGFTHDAAILRAMLETFDEERAFLEVAEAHAEFRRRMGTLKGGIEVIGTQVDAMDDAYRVLAAKREGK